MAADGGDKLGGDTWGDKDTRRYWSAARNRGVAGDFKILIAGSHSFHTARHLAGVDGQTQLHFLLGPTTLHRWTSTPSVSVSRQRGQAEARPRQQQGAA